MSMRCFCLSGCRNVKKLSYWVIGRLGYRSVVYRVIGLLGDCVIGFLGYWVISVPMPPPPPPPLPRKRAVPKVPNITRNFECEKRGQGADRMRTGCGQAARVGVMCRASGTGGRVHTSYEFPPKGDAEFRKVFSTPLDPLRGAADLDGYAAIPPTPWRNTARQMLMLMLTKNTRF